MLALSRLVTPPDHQRVRQRLGGDRGLQSHDVGDFGAEVGQLGVVGEEEVGEGFPEIPELVEGDQADVLGESLEGHVEKEVQEDEGVVVVGR